MFPITRYADCLLGTITKTHMSDDTTNNVDVSTTPADDTPVVTPENGTPESAPVPETTTPETV